MTLQKQESFVTCSIDMKFAERWIDEAVNLLVSAVGCTEAKPGCRECRVARDAAERGYVHYHERWTTEAGFREHLKSDEFKRILVAMDLCCEEPRVVVGSLTGRMGIDYLNELRGGEGVSPEKRRSL